MLQKLFQYTKVFSGWIILLVCLMPYSLQAQGNGDDLLFQGIFENQDLGVKALGMGGAYTAMTGDLNSLFHNPAGLADLTKLSFSISGKSSNKFWMESQKWWGGNQWPFAVAYFSGMLTPDPADDGLDSREIDVDLENLHPDDRMGFDPWDPKFKDWSHSNWLNSFNYLAAALPIELNEDQQLVVSGSFSTPLVFNDMDWNATALSPHPGWYNEWALEDGYMVEWDRYMRERRGTIYSIDGAAAYRYKNLKLGAKVTLANGEAEELITRSRVGQVDMAAENIFFYHDTLDFALDGTSDFSYQYVTLGGVYSFEKVNFGFSVRPSYEILRSWNHDVTTVAVENGVEEINNFTRGNVDTLRLPASFNAGVSVSPVQSLTLSLDVGYNPNKQAELHQGFGADTTKDWFNLAPEDTLAFEGWANQINLKTGISWNIFEPFTLRGGYRSLGSAFLPIGNPFQYEHKGQEAESYTLGFSWRIFTGVLDAAYEYRQIRYRDQYIANVNFAREDLHRFLLAYTLEF